MEAKKKGLFTAARWHDNPFEGATVTKGLPPTEEEKKEIDKRCKEILIHFGVIKKEEDYENLKDLTDTAYK